MIRCWILAIRLANIYRSSSFLFLGSFALHTLVIIVCVYLDVFWYEIRKMNGKIQSIQFPAKGKT